MGYGGDGEGGGTVEEVSEAEEYHFGAVVNGGRRRGGFIGDRVR